MHFQVVHTAFFVSIVEYTENGVILVGNRLLWSQKITSQVGSNSKKGHNFKLYSVFGCSDESKRAYETEM